MKPVILAEGDSVEILAPGSGVPSQTVDKAVALLRELGLQPRVPSSLLSPYLYHSNTDASRLKMAKASFRSAESKAIWCLRGGYGSLRLIAGLQSLKRPQQSKLLIGMSDITSLHAFVWNHWKWPSLHASLLDRMISGELPASCKTATLDLVFGRKTEMIFSGLTPLNRKAIKCKHIEGPILGGNMVTLQSHLGTKTTLKTSGGIVFLEDIGERAYRLDRIFYHFQACGFFRGVKAVILGQFSRCEEPDGNGSLVRACLERFAEDLDPLGIPVFSGIPSGHGQDLWPLPLGCKSEILRSDSGFQLKANWC